MWGFVRRAATRLLDADSRLLRTLILLFSRPGRLTVHYLRGNRQPYVSPVQFFALVNVLIVLLGASGTMQAFNTSLRLHVTASSFFHQDLAERWVNVRIDAPPGWQVQRAMALKNSLQHAADGSAAGDPTPATPSQQASLDALNSFREYASRFDRRAQMLSESLVFLLIPMLVALFAAMDVRQTGPRPAGGLLPHLVQATHVTAFWLLILPLSAIAVTVAFALLVVAGLISAEDIQRWKEPVWTVTTRVAVAGYVVGGVRQVYRASWIGAIIRGGIVGLLLIPCLQVYRAVLFIVGFYTT